MSLKLLIKSAVNLVNSERLGGLSDPYVTVSFQGEKQKTSVQKSTLTPEWNEELIWNVSEKPPRPDETMELEVKDYERIGWNKLMGKASLPLRNLLQGGSGTLELEQPLLDSHDQTTTGLVKMSVTYTPPASAAATSAAGASAAPTGKSATSAPLSKPSGAKSKRTLTPDAAAQPSFSGGGPAVPPVAGESSHRDQLSNVSTNFQIRVRVVEARQLMGGDLNAVCRVRLEQGEYQDNKQTRVVKGSQAPWFNELFFFNLECLPDQLMESILEFRVCNSSLLRSSTIIGNFKCELGLVYGQKDHSFINKWLVLSHPEEETPTVQGYLKVSISVLGPGNKCPDMPVTQSATDDVETNLLWSAGVHLQPANFKVSAFCAQDLPRMDSGTLQSLKEVLGIGKASKELVDPYLVCSFAGREIQTKVMYCNDNPEFRQTLQLGFLFPSMCNSLKLALMDWDRVGNDDVIGTATIPISLISASGDDGFLPTFGPAYVNFYGAQREWELWESKDKEIKNKGELAGVAYRGRVLLSIHTEVGAYPSSPFTNMGVLEFEKVRRYRATRNFTLMAHFTNVSLLTEAGKALQVEVSIGNFGNKLENSLMPSPSTTHPANPVFDGCKYYYLAWGEASPLIAVQCQFEDITHRLEASNALANIATSLQKDLKNIKISQRCKKANDDYKSIFAAVKTTLEKVKVMLDTPLPFPDPVKHCETSLDVHLKEKRKIRMVDLNRNVGKLLSSFSSKRLGNLKEMVKEAIEELETIVFTLMDLAIEPQSSIPDVFVWLMSGAERLAYVRIPAKDILFSSVETACGSECGNFSSFPMIYPDSGEIGGIVRGSLWLGRTDEVKQWWTKRGDLQPAIYAESYENEVSTIGSEKWSKKGALMNRPPYSDADGLISLEKENILCPEGWIFQGDWIVSPDPSIQFNQDAGHAVYTEEVFEQQARVPGGNWIDAPTHWADVRGDPAAQRDEIDCPSGWAWLDVWTTDLQRAVDCDGWEYTVQKGITGWSPQQKVYHVLRRRRWCRERSKLDSHKNQKALSEAIVDGWEYASLFGRRYHARQRRIDVVRRRRWRRKMVPVESSLASTSPPTIMTKSEKEDEPQQISCPRQYVVSAERHSYQLRAHIYQARDLNAGDKTGLSDPYAVVSFCDLSQQTEKQRATLCPTWDQTLLFDGVKISGPLLNTAEAPVQSPPSVVINVFDWDARGSPEYLGTAICKPTVRDPIQGYEPTPLQWFPLTKRSNNTVEECGELLASFELLLGGLEDPPPSRGNVFMVPFDVRPRLQKTRIEVLCWGVRNMSTFELQSVTRPSIEFECGGHSVTSSIMKNLRSNPNFDSPHLTFDVELPKEELYMPPLSLRVQDHRSFGSKPVVATAVISDLKGYTVAPSVNREKIVSRASLGAAKHSSPNKVIPKDSRVTPTLALSSTQKGIEPGTVDSEVDWWSKFYASVLDQKRSGTYLSKGYETMEVLPHSLEDMSHFNSFTDLISSVPLVRGKGDGAIQVGEFKGTFRVYPLPPSSPPTPFLSAYPSPSPRDVTARVYVVLAKDLAPKDSGGSSDPYVVVKFGKQSRSNIKEYRPNTLCPVFGSVFEVTGTLPLNKDLTVQVWDKDLTSSDDLIGETVLDLENRYLTRHRATVGLPKQYHVSGPNKWRDSDLPSVILNEYCHLHHYDILWTQSPLSVTVDDEKYSLDDFELPEVNLPPSIGPRDERLALHVLQRLFKLVPEHVETRDLTHPARPGLPQGKLMLWVDLFPSNITIPPAVDITPRKPHQYEVRVVIYNVYDVPLQESNIVGEKMSDVYVKAWLQGTDNVLKTDVHYRCMDGEANFNWRFVFPFEYLEAEQSLVVKKKTHFYSSDETEEHRPAQLTMQLWDNDLLLHDDFLSEITLDLCRMPKPARKKNKVVTPIKSLDTSGLSAATSDGTSTTIMMGDKPDEPLDLVNLFQVKRVSGFFPFSRLVDGEMQVAGRLEAELEVLHTDEVKGRPAGLGRDPPNLNPVLKEPNRPATSFFWLSSPWKSFKHVLWGNYKWHIITFIVVFFMVLFALMMIYSLPEATVDYMLGTNN